MSTRSVAVLLGLALSLACSAPKVRQSTPAGPSAVHELWQERTDLAALDLFHGAGGPELAPDARGRFHFLSQDTTGASRGYSVRDEQDREWDVKIGIEAQPESAPGQLGLQNVE
jgi:hypothetical protein